MNSAPNITAAFKALRKQGVVCRQSFKCCRSCAGSALAQECEEGREVCYYTKQDASSLREKGWVYLRFGTVNTDDDARTVAVGKRVAAALVECGCPVEWNGSADESIKAYRDVATFRAEAMARLGAADLKPQPTKRRR